MILKSYTIEELPGYVKSDRYARSDVIPVSPTRVNSFLANPRARETDQVLFELYHDERLVAYRTLLPDWFFDKSGTPQRFAWLSGNYVHPDYRRRGFSSKLFKMAEAGWDGRLMYTNFAPESKAVYDKTGMFELLKQRDGLRFYLRASSFDLLKGRIGSRKVLRTGDNIVNRIADRKLKRFPHIKDDSCIIQEMNQMDPEMSALQSSAMKEALFSRDTEAFNWILKYPWITDKGADPISYHFSYIAEQFLNVLLKFDFIQSEGSGFLWLVIHDRKLSVPYYFANHESLYPFMAQKIIQAMISNNCAYATIRSSTILNHLQPYRKWFIGTKKMPQLIFAHKNLIKEIPKNRKFYDGDGDVVFTG